MEDEHEVPFRVEPIPRRDTSATVEDVEDEGDEIVRVQDKKHDDYPGDILSHEEGIEGATWSNWDLSHTRTDGHDQHETYGREEMVSRNDDDSDGADSWTTITSDDSSAASDAEGDGAARHLAYDLRRWQINASPDAAEKAIQELQKLAPGYRWAIKRDSIRGNYAYGRPSRRKTMTRRGIDHRNTDQPWLWTFEDVQRYPGLVRRVNPTGRLARSARVTRPNRTNYLEPDEQAQILQSPNDVLPDQVLSDERDDLHLDEMERISQGSGYTSHPSFETGSNSVIDAGLEESDPVPEDRSTPSLAATERERPSPPDRRRPRVDKRQPPDQQPQLERRIVPAQNPPPIPPYPYDGRFSATHTYPYPMLEAGRSGYPYSAPQPYFQPYAMPYSSFSPYPYNMPSMYPVHDPYPKMSSLPQPSAPEQKLLKSNNISSPQVADFGNRGYNFVLPGYSRSALTLEDSSTESELILQENEKSSRVVPIVGRFLGTSCNTLMSRYVGQGVLGGMHQVKLQILPEMSQSHRCLFRWIHFNDASMIFEDFEVLRIPELSDSERSLLGQLLISVKHKFKKPFQASKTTMHVSFLQETFLGLERSKDPAQDRKTATWTCLPFFLLSRHGGQTTDFESGSHNVPTLLQYHFPSTAKERDLQQAVCNLPSNPSGHCFHITQIWSVILDTSLIVTCAPMSLNTLQKDNMNIDPCPKIDNPVQDSQRLMVFYGTSVLWSLLLIDCQTWFVSLTLIIKKCGEPDIPSKSFLQHFTDFWPQEFEIECHNQILTAELWPQVLRMAARSRRTLELKFRCRDSLTVQKGLPRLGKLSISPNGQDPTQDNATSIRNSVSHHDKHKTTVPLGTTNLTTSRASESKERKRKIISKKAPASRLTSDQEFSVFTWINESIRQGKEIDEEQLQRDLGSIDNFLRNETSLHDRIAYRNCSDISYNNILTSLLNEESSIQTYSDQPRQMLFATKVETFCTFSSISEFFLPLMRDGPTVTKFWGAVMSILRTDKFMASPSGSSVESPTSKSSSVEAATENAGPMKSNVGSSPLNAGDSASDASSNPAEGSEKSDLSDSNEDKPRAKHYGMHSRTPNIRSMGANNGGWDLHTRFRKTVRKMQAFREFLSEASTAERQGVVLPSELIKAWLHIVMTMVIYSNNPFAWSEHLEMAIKLLNEGMEAVMRSIGKGTLLKNMMVMPTDLMSLVSLKCLSDFVGDRRDLGESYTEYMKQIEIEIKATPLQRQNLDKLTRLKQEILVILETLNSQRQIMDGVKQSAIAGGVERHPGRHGDRSDPVEILPKPRLNLDFQREQQHIREPPIQRAGNRRLSQRRREEKSNPQGKNKAESRWDHSRLEPTNPRGFHDLFTQECLSLIDNRIQLFTDMSHSTRDLERYHLRMISSNKDRQEAAIYIFTVVTIVFLPISTVAGIFGMNTNDIRNMDANQWAFWLVAIPLSTIVIISCLGWAGYLSKFGIWQFWRQGRSPQHQAAPPLSPFR